MVASVRKSSFPYFPMFRRFLSTGCCSTVFALACATPGSAQELGARTYTNARFGYTLQYPSALLLAKPEADNSDGRRFESRDHKVLLRAFGAYNVDNQSIGSKLKRVAADWRVDGAQVTYQKSGEGWYAVSGFVGGDIFYEKALLRDGTWATLIWEYPKSYRQRLDTSVTRTVRSFRLGKVSYVTPSTTARRPQAKPRPRGESSTIPSQAGTPKLAKKVRVRKPAPTVQTATPVAPPRATTSRGY